MPRNRPLPTSLGLSTSLVEGSVRRGLTTCRLGPFGWSAGPTVPHDLRPGAPPRKPLNGASDVLQRVHRFGNLLDPLIHFHGRFLEAGDRLRGIFLDRLDHSFDLAGMLLGLPGKRFHLVRHDGESLVRFAGTGGLDRGVERQYVGCSAMSMDHSRTSKSSPTTCWDRRFATCCKTRSFTTTARSRKLSSRRALARRASEFVSLTTSLVSS